MQPTKAKHSGKEQLLILIACLFLFMGIGRIFSLVTHNPVLGYANSYDMIRLQACHQIWPADKFVNITAGTPSAPLRRYTLDKRVDTPCFPSSELLFTSIGIELAKLKNRFTGETLISIKTIGLVKATFLSLTVLLASLFFYRRAMYSALLANALVTAVILSDPGVTLYLNTFYTEFSAVYFLYLALVGVAALTANNSRSSTSWIFLIGLLGFGLSKPQHIYLTLFIAAVICCWFYQRKAKLSLTLLTLCVAITPFTLQVSGKWSPKNVAMEQASHINLMGSLLSTTDQKKELLKSLQLPDSCIKLSGKNSFDPETHQASVCVPLTDTSQTQLLLSAAIHHPNTLATMTYQAIPQLKQWLYTLYGQVEGRSFDSVVNYHQSIGSFFWQISTTVFFIIWSLPLWIAIALLLIDFFRKKQITHHAGFLFLLTTAQWFVLLTALLGNGMVDLAKNAHLAMCLCVASYILIICGCLVHKNRLTNPLPH